MQKSIIYENELYVARYPLTESEIEVQEAFFVSEYRDNPRFLMLGIKQEDLRLQFLKERDHEIEHHQRISVIEKSSDEIVGAYRLYRWG